jgi:hypothetical protein
MDTGMVGIIMEGMVVDIMMTTITMSTSMTTTTTNIMAKIQADALFALKLSRM